MRLKAPADHGNGALSVQGAVYSVDDTGHVEIGSEAHAKELVESHGFVDPTGKLKAAPAPATEAKPAAAVSTDERFAVLEARIAALEAKPNGKGKKSDKADESSA